MQLALILIHLIACLSLIVIVLLQTGKGSEIGAVFGGSSQTLFGSSGGGTFFGKLTTGVAIVFMLSSLVLAGRANRYTSESVMTDVQPAVSVPVPISTTTIPVTTPETTPAPKENQTPADTPVAEQTESPAPAQSEGTSE